MNTQTGRRLEDLTERQQRAAHVIRKKWGLELDDVAAHFDALMRLLQGELTVAQAEGETGLLIIDRSHLSLF